MLSLFDQGPAEPCPDDFNMAQYVLARAGLLADKTMLSVVGAQHSRHYSFGEIETAVRGVATGLLQQGLRPGDKILMRLGNSVEFPILFLAAITADLIPVPTSSQLTRPEVSRICRELHPSLIVSAAFAASCIPA